jgi:hypothetical protein
VELVLRWRDCRRGAAQLQGEGDQALLGAVVQVPLDAPPDLVGGGHDPGPRGHQLGVGLGVGDRGGDQLGELLDALLRVGRQAFAHVRDGHDAPEVALDNDRGGNGRDHAHFADAVGDRT